MQSNVKVGESVGVTMERLRPIIEGLEVEGKWLVEHVRGGRVIGRYDVKNLITTEGKNAMLDIMFHGSTQVTTWYQGLIDSSGYTAVAVGDTMSSHAGWNEFTSYSESVRQTWVEAAASASSITSSAVSTFTMSGSGTVKGLFLVSNSTKSGTTGTLWCATLFSSAVAVISGDTIKLTYTVNLS